MKTLPRQVPRFSYYLCLLVLFAIYFFEIFSAGIKNGMAVQLLGCTLSILLLEKSESTVPAFLQKHDELVLFLLSPLYIQFAVYGQWISDWRYLLYTYCIIASTASFICALIGSIRTGVSINLIAYTILLIVNDTVMQFRKNFFFPADILSLKTALSVGTAYMGSYKLTGDVIAALIAVYLFFSILHRCFPKRQANSILLRVLSLAMSVLFFFTVPTPSDYISGEFRTAEKVERYGYISVFSLELQALHHTAPDGYDVDQAAMELGNNSEQISAEDSPNIIVILDESFCDYTMVGSLSTNQDFMPFIRQLQQECQSGVVYVPSWSGKTCNTEWEVLTGNSIAFYPGTVPFTQFITSPTFSLASHLLELDYNTTAIHPYYATGYRRDEVYPMIGFEEDVFIEDFDSRYVDMAFHTRPDAEQLAQGDNLHIRDMISDKASFDKIIECFEANQAENKKSFIFNLTMQNHAPYTYSEFSNTIESNISLLNPDKGRMDQYLSLLVETDKAFQSLIEYFSNVDEKTIILFMGDHQPGLDNEIYNELWGYDWENEDWSFQENLSRYAIPYVMWANFDCETSHDYSILSSNFISLLLMDAADLDMGGWYEMLHKVYQNYPVINNAGIMDSICNWTPYAIEMVNKDALLLHYQNLQYYRMFDE